MNNEEKEKLIKLAKKYTYEPASENFLDAIEKEMAKLVCSRLSDYKDKEVYAKFLYERKKYHEAIKKFNWIAHVKECKARVSYGLYKCYIMIEDYNSAYKSIIDYIDERKNDDILAGMGILISCFDIIFNGNYINIDITDQFLMNKIKDQELKEKYSELIENFNKRNFSKCITLAEKCDEICKAKKIMIEFETFKRLLTKVKEISSPDLYKYLKQAKEEKDFDRLVEILKELPKFNIKDKKLFYSSLYLLAKNNYYKEVEDILLSLYVTNEDKFIISVLKKTIVNQIEYEKLLAIEKDNYEKAINLGKKYYNEHDIATAFDEYSFGYYTTRNNIFLYYIGKMVLKAGEPKLAKEYFEKYVKVGSDKLAKAYIYLASIYYGEGKYKEALRCGKLVESLNLLYEEKYEMFYIPDYKNPDEDTLKMRLQTYNSMYKGFFDEEEKVLKLNRKETQN